MNIRMRDLLALRGDVSDQALLDYVTLAHLVPDAGSIPTPDLCQRWGCSRPQVSRRMSAVAATGLADITSIWGAYQVHHVNQLESS